MTHRLAVLLSLTACAMSGDDLPHPSIVAAVELPAVNPPPMPTPEGERLFQLLYAGETGDAAWAQGQKARIFGWLRIMELSPGELNALLVLSDEVAGLAAAAEAHRAQQDARELAAYGPIYARINAALTNPATTDGDLAALAGELETARKSLEAEGDPWVQQLDDLDNLLDKVEPWYEILDRSKRERASAARFFLTRRAAPLTNPGEYAALTGMIWDGGDFSALHRTGRPQQQYQLDLGGLWSMEALRSAPGEYLKKRQVQSILVLALLEPAFAPALRDWLAATAPPGPASTDAPPAGSSPSGSPPAAPPTPPSP